MKKLNIHIEVNNKYWDEFCSVQHAINELIDLVNSQQEAIGELQTEIGVLRNMVLQSQEAIEELQSNSMEMRRAINKRVVNEPADDKPTAKEIARAILDEPLDFVSKARYAEKLGIHKNPHEHVYRCQDCEKTQAEVEDSDTHRTVTLRIPKGMRIGEAIETAWQRSNGPDVEDKWHMFEVLDTDLQKALDEVQPNE